MSTSAAHKLANARYRQNKRKTIATDVPKEKGEQYQAFASRFGLSMSLLVQRGVEEFIQRHASEVNLPEQTAPITTPEEKISDRDKKFLNAVNQLPADAQKSLLKFLQSLNAQQVNVAAENKAENTAKNASVTNHEPI